MKKIRNICIIILIFTCLFSITACEEDKYEYVRSEIPICVEHQVKQKTLTNEEIIAVTFLAPTYNDPPVVEVTIYDNKNQAIAKITATNDDIKFDRYPSGYIFSITIQKSQYPTAKTAKITAYKCVAYERRT